VVADSQWDPAATAPHRHAVGVITRLPQTRTRVSQVLTPALRADRWPRRDDTPRDQRVAGGHDRLAQCGLGVSAQVARERAAASGTNAHPRDEAARETPRWHGHATRLATPEAAHAALAALATGWPDLPGEACNRLAPTRDAHQGRPPSTPPMHVRAWQMPAQVRPATATMAPRKPPHACVVLGPTIDARQWHAADVMAAATGQAQAAGGVRLLKAPRGGVAAWCVKTPSVAKGDGRVRPCAGGLYAGAPRRRRQP